MIEAKALTKFFSGRKVVDNVSFTVRKGEVLGFLGPNAAGKSTTMRMLIGYLPASGGKAMIGGYDVAKKPLAVHRIIGYLPENAPVYPEMTVTEFLSFIAEIRGYSGLSRKKKVEQIIERCFLEEVRRQTIGTLSKGYKQRVCFAQSILHDPEYLIMDEPTDGLDPNQKHEVRSMISEMGRDKAIILSTHILEEVDAVCTRAVIIARGKVVADDTPEGLRARSSLHGAVTATVASDDPAAAAAAIEAAPGVDRVVTVLHESGMVTVRAFPGQKDTALAEVVVERVRASGMHLSSLVVEKGRLDEVFRNITQ